MFDKNIKKKRQIVSKHIEGKTQTIVFQRVNGFQVAPASEKFGIRDWLLRQNLAFRN
jgi:hypothetical protein